MTDADRLVLTQAAIAVYQRSWAARDRVVEEVERAGRYVLTDAEQTEFLRLTRLLSNLNSRRQDAMSARTRVARYEGWLLRNGLDYGYR
jgi:hypothetical protein